MSEQLSTHDIERFRDSVRRGLGLQFDDSKLNILGKVLRQRLDKLKCLKSDYLEATARRIDVDEAAELARELTVTESYFFRNIEQFDAFREIVLPTRMRRQERSRTLRVLSAACASGEEAYTLAIIVRESLPDPAWRVSIRAVDINPIALSKARRAQYAAWALRETPPDAQRRWFRSDDRIATLDEALRADVAFEARNLAASDPELWEPDSYDAIFCRNVLMYFAPEQARGLVGRIRRALVPGGYLFLGHAETLRGLSDEFDLLHTHGTFYYQSREPGEARRPIIAAADDGRLFNAAPHGDAPVWGLGDDWFDSILRAGERIETLAAAALSRSGVDSPSDSGRVAFAPWDKESVLALLGGERYSDALAKVQNLPPEADSDPDALLLKAMLLTHGGQPDKAIAACEALLALDEMSAGAHYILALCREGLGDLDAAIEHDRISIHLDGSFAMPRLHLGLMARRAGDLISARQELSKALLLLQHEDNSRLLLFGGGFNRKALLALCSSSLRESETQP